MRRRRTRTVDIVSRQTRDTNHIETVVATWVADGWYCVELRHGEVIRFRSEDIIMVTETRWERT